MDVNVFTDRMLILSSGGLDSTVTAYYARSLGAHVNLLHITYGQRHAAETRCAQLLAQRLHVSLYVLHLPLWTAKDTTLIGDAPVETTSYRRGHMSTYVPARNTVFASIAMSYMETLRIQLLGLGVHTTETYPDTRPQWVSALERLMQESLELSVLDSLPVQVWAPFVHKTKVDIVRKGLELDVPFQFTWSCYAPEITPNPRQPDHVLYVPCGKCATCRDRQNAFNACGAQDPLLTCPGLAIHKSHIKEEITLDGEIE